MPTLLKNKILDFVDDGCKLETTASKELTCNAFRIKGVLDPVDAQDVSSKSYVDSAVSGSVHRGAGDGLVLNGNDLDVNVDNVSLQITADTVSVKAGGISASSLATNAVSTVKVVDGAITSAKLASGAVANANLANDSLTITAGDGLSGGGATALGASSTIDVDATVLRTNVAQVVSASRTHSNTIFVSDSTDATTATSGSIRTSGGLGVVKDIVCGADISCVNLTTTSDERKKENIETLKKKEAKEVLKKLNPVEFDYKHSGKHSTGLVAQQVKEVLPHLVREDSEGMLSVDYLGLMGYIISALQ